MSENEARAKYLAVVGSSIDEVSLGLLGHRSISTDIVGISLRGPRTEDEEILMTVRGLSDDGSPVVAFLVGPNLGGLFVSLAAALRAGKLHWREDTYRTGG